MKETFVGTPPPPSSDRRLRERGFALISTFLVLSLLSTLLGAYLVISRIELATTKASRDTSSGFYAAEAGLNIRAETIRGIFVGYNTPSGESPDTENNPCEGANTGTGDMVCENFNFNNRTVRTYVVDHQAGMDPPLLPIRQGLYQGLNAQDYIYTAHSEALSIDGRTEAILQLRFKSRVVPMFQFAAFYDKDLEILPGPSMNLNGPVHTNGDLYMQSDNTLTINGQVTSGGTMYRGRKNDNSCRANSTRVYDPTNPQHLVSVCPNRTTVTATHTNPFNGMIQFDVDTVTVPPPEILDPVAGSLYWDKADLRIVLNTDAALNPIITVPGVTTGIEVRNSNQSVDAAATLALYNCSAGQANNQRSIRRNPAAGDNALAVVGTSYSFRNNRENKNIRMLDIDLRGLLNCLHSTNWLGTNNRTLGDTTEGGLVLYFTATGPNALSNSSPYGVRIRNGQTLQSNIGGAPSVVGLTIVSDQAVYLQGNYNSTGKRPAAILADSFHPLSNNFYDSTAQNFRDSTTTQSVSNRPATSTIQNVAVLSGTDTTGGQEGSAGQGGAYNGGLENYPRFHENWTGNTYTYRGSFVSLNRPRRYSGAWVYGNPQYTAPNRNWDYDTDFNNAANLPPISPRFVYLQQELFVRDFEQ
jgi:hypothetical protein